MKTTKKLAITLLCTIGMLYGCQQDARLISPSERANLTSEISTNNVSINATCSAQGWASLNGGTNGGGTATPTVVTTYAQLKAAIENTSVRVVQVNGTITIPSGGRISFRDQTAKTVFGSRGARLVTNDQTKDGSGIFNVRGCRNIIFRNLIFEGPGAYDVDGWDLMVLDNCTNVWVDHCEFRDGCDGNFDIKSASDFITVSYCKFNYLKPPRAGGPGGANDHRYSNLIGSSDGATGDRGKLQITFARNWWGPGCRERMPRVRFGKVHMLNNYFNSTVSNRCIQAGFEANLLVESNVFEGVRNSIDLMNGTATAVQSRNNIFTNVTGTNAGNGRNAFTPPYSYTALSASSVKSNVTGSTGAGATLSGNVCTFSAIY